MVQVHTLPPTSAATENHSKRVFLQVQEWLGKTDQLNPEKWGWTCKNGKLFPDTVSLPAAPESLLTVIRCSSRQTANPEGATAGNMDLTVLLPVLNAEGSAVQMQEKLETMMIFLTMLEETKQTSPCDLWNYVHS